MAVSVVDVARRAGVSLGTVSNVLNRPDRVSAANRERVMEAITELGFVRNEAARQLRAGRSRTVGFIVLDVGNPYFIDVAAGIEDVAIPLGLSVMLCNSADQRDRAEHYLTLLEEQRVFGVLLTPVPGMGRLISAIQRRGTPVVLVDSRSNSRQCAVSVDDVVGGVLAAGSLFDRGHTQLAFVGGPQSLSQVIDRLAGVRQSAERHVADATVDVVETAAMTFAEGYAAGRRILELPPARRPTGICCANDLLALGLMRALAQGGARVPDDFAIIGYDDIEFAAASAVPLSSIRQPTADIGRVAMGFLAEEVLEGLDHTHKHRMFRPELIVRQSSGK